MTKSLVLVAATAVACLSFPRPMPAHQSPVVARYVVENLGRGLIALRANNGTKATSALSADLFGDWREEVIWRTTDNNSLRIYSTTERASNRIYTLMHDPHIVHRDTLGPAFKSLTASKTTLWPPNHQMIPVSQPARLVDLLDPLLRRRSGPLSFLVPTSVLLDELEATAFRAIRERFRGVSETLACEY